MSRTLICVLFLLPMSLTATTSAHNQTVDDPSRQGSLVIPSGDRILLRLQHRLTTKGSKKGDRIELRTVHDLFLGNQMALPHGLTVNATVMQSHRRRAITMIDRPELHLRLDHLALPDGSLLPLSAKILRVGFIPFRQHDGGTVELKGHGAGRRGVAHVGGSAARGALVGGPVGAAVGAASGVISQSMTYRRDIELPEGITFEIELIRDLEIPADSHSMTEWLPSRAARISPLLHLISGRSSPPDSRRPTDLPAPAPSAPGDGNARMDQAPHPDLTPGDFKVKVNVDLVTLETVVRDAGGKMIEELRREDFRVLDDGVQQDITHFSRDQLPLAVALVVDRSGSVARYLPELQRAALETLVQLKPGDQVAVFAFAGSVARLLDLTEDLKGTAETISGIRPMGGTNIYDAVFDAAQYLGSSSPDRRRAVILISDNQPTTPGRASESGAIRMALESETVVYSIKTPGAIPIPMSARVHPRFAAQALWIGDPGSVPRIAQETGGEVLDATELGSLSQALGAAISRLKSRYTLGYTPSNHSRDGRFHRVEVRLADSFGCVGENYTAHTRRGYYASAFLQSSR